MSCKTMTQGMKAYFLFLYLLFLLPFEILFVLFLYYTACRVAALQINIALGAVLFLLYSHVIHRAAQLVKVCSGIYIFHLSCRAVLTVTISCFCAGGSIGDCFKRNGGS